MNKNVIIVDDDESFRFFITDHIKNMNLQLNPVDFAAPSLALDHIRKRSEPAALYLVDMNPYLGKSFSFLEYELGYVREKYPELEATILLYEELRSSNWHDRFYYMTSHLGDWGEGILQRTGASHIMKYAPGARSPVICLLDNISSVIARGIEDETKPD